MKLRSLAIAMLIALFTIATFATVRFQAQDIVATAGADPDLKTLTELITKAGLADTLKGAGPFTVLAPTDKAFEKLKSTNPKAYDAVTTNPDLLKKVLTYHVIEGKVGSADLKDGAEQKTLEGETLKVAIKKGKVRLNKSRVTKPDIAASNGVIHEVGTVLIPPSVEADMAKPASG